MYTGDIPSVVDAERRDKDNALDLLAAMESFQMMFRNTSEYLIERKGPPSLLSLS
jgi:hypothetical protein